MTTTVTSRLISWLSSATGAIKRTVQQKLSDTPPSLKDFGAVGDGVTDDTLAIQRAEACSSKKIYVPAGTYLSTTLLTSSLLKTYIGPGQLKLKTWSGSALMKSAPFSAHINSRPTWGGINTAQHYSGFNGDYKHNLFCADVFVEGDVHGAPGEGAYYAPELYPCVVSVHNLAGRNGVTGTAADRTMMLAYYTPMINAGAGDMGAYNACMSIQGNYESSTNFLQNQSIGIVGGQVESFVDHGFIQGGETLMQDHGHNIAAIGLNYNMIRDSTSTFGSAAVGGQPTAPNHPWIGYKINSQSNPIDVAFQATGKIGVGLDFSAANFKQREEIYDGAAIAMCAGHKTFLNVPATTYPSWSPLWPECLASWDNTYFEYNSELGGVFFAVHSKPVMTLRADISDIATRLKLVDIAANRNYANDAAAATAGLQIGEVYHTAGTLKIRIA